MALHEYQKQMYKKVAIIVALIILPVAGFFAGMAYQRQTGMSTAAATAQGRFGGASGRFGSFRNRAIGTVKAIDSSSITVTSRMDGTDHTYTVTSSTTFMNGTSTAQASDVQVGDTVLVTLDSSDNTKATQITINPMFQRPNANAQSSSGSTPDAQLQ